MSTNLHVKFPFTHGTTSPQFSGCGQDFHTASFLFSNQLTFPVPAKVRAYHLPPLLRGQKNQHSLFICEIINDRSTHGKMFETSGLKRKAFKSSSFSEYSRRQSKVNIAPTKRWNRQDQKPS